MIRMGQINWECMDAAYTALLDHLVPQNDLSNDERRAEMKHALAGSPYARWKLAVSIAASATADTRSPRRMYRAIRLWQSAYRECVARARAGGDNLRVRHDDDYTSVIEPLSGMGVKFYHDGRISSDASAKSRTPKAFIGKLDDTYFGDPEHFIGVGIGRWVYLHGAELAAPARRWPTNSAGLRPYSGSPHVRAWLHSQQPYRWAPVHRAGRASCGTCEGGTPEETADTWLHLPPSAGGDQHRLVPLPRNEDDH
ncbi:hypothetical protein [Tsukamurella ocularis]|uniref:hypothetical protein n=1 Tax=Tsukamurella ocularis TaxID=1970234 RepID=UPI0021697AAA|nr:hypothetical protein [Tsukamurella ocularis]MCS3779320.1 hypothetical protein [Tsukamurella ocularis]MCS3787060.1 hypothetical protein [Tsukamurella ocularis]MCS3852451.1 hypothetical protein [Tsukamurella ocularis]